MFKRFSTRSRELERLDTAGQNIANKRVFQRPQLAEHTMNNAHFLLPFRLASMAMHSTVLVPVWQVWLGSCEKSYGGKLRIALMEKELWSWLCRDH